MRTLFATLMVAAMCLLFTSCSDYGEGDFHNGADEQPDTVSGSTIPNDEPDPDTTTGATSEGSMSKGRIGTGSFTVGGQTVSDAYGIDLDKDGRLEYRIINNGTALQPVDGHAVAVGGESIALFQKHATVGASATYSASTASLPALSSLPEKFYVGLRLNMSGVHYGWAKVKYDDGELEWDKCAYCTSANVAVTAGDD